MQSKQPSEDKMKQAVKSYYGLKLTKMLIIMQMCMLMKSQLQMDIVYM